MKNNYVAKNAYKYNTSKAFEDRKRRHKKGYSKHKKCYKQNMPEE